MENPIKMDDLGGKPTIFGNTPYSNGAIEPQPLQTLISSIWSSFWWVHAILPAKSPYPKHEI